MWGQKSVGGVLDRVKAVISDERELSKTLAILDEQINKNKLHLNLLSHALGVQEEVNRPLIDMGLLYHRLKDPKIESAQRVSYFKKIQEYANNYDGKFHDEVEGLLIYLAGKIVESKDKSSLSERLLLARDFMALMRGALPSFFIKKYATDRKSLLINQNIRSIANEDIFYVKKNGHTFSHLLLNIVARHIDQAVIVMEVGKIPSQESLAEFLELNAKLKNPVRLALDINGNDLLIINNPKNAGDLHHQLINLEHQTLHGQQTAQPKFRIISH
jgi:hypothetical protein